VIVSKRVRRPGVVAVCAKLPADERTVVEGIPVTTVPRTLLDLAAVVPAHELRRALERAEALGLGDRLPLPELLSRHRGGRGAARLRAALERGVAAALTRSELEERFLSFVERHDLPRPQVNVWLPELGVEVDCAWRAERVVAELDGRAFHDGPEAFERDRARDRRLQAAGWRVLRITWAALRDQSAGVAADLEALLDPATSARRATP
jgi:very-short-patch-repair endonuclease